MRAITVVTVARSDYGIYLPLLHKIQAAPDLKLQLLVSGMHLSPEFGLTVAQIEADGFTISDRVEMLLSSDTPAGITKSMGLGLIGFAQAYTRFRPDILVVLGDRFEMHTAALAALPFKIPVAHLHGGELTQGAIDDALRHSMTKLSHLHFVSTAEYGRRIKQLGEESWRIVVSGAPALDNISTVKFLTKPELERNYNLQLDQPPLLVTFHPVTLEYEQSQWQVEQLLAVLVECQLPLVFTKPNADTGGRVIIRLIEDFVQYHAKAYIVDNLGMRAYFSMMSIAAAMVGNSSSGIIEAASFELPVVNIGNRQAGRVRGGNVIDVDYKQSAILVGLHQALDAQFRVGLHDMTNPYGSGMASEKIVKVLGQVQLDDKLIIKRFFDME